MLIYTVVVKRSSDLSWTSWAVIGNLSSSSYLFGKRWKMFLKVTLKNLSNYFKTSSEKCLEILENH